MTSFEMWSLILSIFAILISGIAIIISIYYSNKSLGKSEVQNLIALGNIEIAINQSITNTRQRVEDLTIQITPYISKKISNTITEEEKIHLESLQQVLKSSIENNINAYDDACSKYLDGKVDKDRFKKKFFTELRQLVESENYKDYFNSVTSRYKPILKVYKQWHDIEN